MLDQKPNANAMIDLPGIPTMRMSLRLARLFQWAIGQRFVQIVGSGG